MGRGWVLFFVFGVFACDDGASVDPGAADAGAAVDGSRDPTPDARPSDSAVDAQPPTGRDRGLALDVGLPDHGSDTAIDDGGLDARAADAGPGPDAAAPPTFDTPLITEIVARAGALRDDDDEPTDWIEIHNPSGAPYDLAGHGLSDDPDVPDKWLFPAVTLAPGAYRVVFASGKDRAAPDAPLHTNFRLAGDGESVVLSDPNGAPLHAIEDWPGQVEGVAYGLPMRVGRREIVGAGAPARLWVGPDPEGAEAADFDDSGWVDVTQSAGVDRRADGDLVGTDVSHLLGPADVFWLRVPIDVPAGLDALELELTYDDGVTVWLDGEPLYRDNDALGAAVDRLDSQAAGPVRLPLPEGRAGPGVVTVRVVDAAVDDDLFFASVGLVSRGIVIDPRPRYLPQPTPGAPNLSAPGGLPPLVADVDRGALIVPAQALDIGALVLETDAPVADVTLVYKVMFGPERRAPMGRDGQRWRARLPADLAEPGQLVRWAVEARDANGRAGRFPPFLDPLDSEQYVGSIVDPGPIETNLPVYHWFVEDLEAANTEAGTRAALWYDGELYDNIYVDRHGQATTVFPKKSFNFDFNRDHRFRVRDDLERVKDFDLLTNYADKSKMRNTVSYGMFRDAGHDYHLVFPVRLHRNGEFFAVYEFVEDPDERWLRRMGYEAPLGAVYKAYDRLVSVNGSEKKTREDEGTEDLAALIAGIGDLDYVYDHVDWARMANFMALLFITSGRDCCTKNYYAYHDLHTDTWWFMPWDIDLTLGRNWTGTYFNDDMWPENALYQGSNNRLTSFLFNQPDFLEMYHRRVRSLADLLMQPPGVPYAERYLENEVDRWLAHMGDDAELDNDVWGSWGDIQTQAEAVRIMKEDWIVPRRQYIYGELAQREGGPLVRLIDGRPRATGARYRVPTDDALGEAWTARGFDDGAWAEGRQGFGYEDDNGTYGALLGTELRPRDVRDGATSIQLRIHFQVDAPPNGLTLRMKYDDGYVAWLNGVEVARRNVAPGPLRWNSEAAVHDDGRAVLFEDVDIFRFADRLQVGENVLAIQVVNTGNDSSDLLLLAELVDGQPAGDGPLPPAQGADLDVAIEAIAVEGPESYVTLHNREGTAADLSGWRLSGQGIEHTLAAGTVIPAGGRLYVVANLPAFRGRGVGPGGGQRLLMQGNWRGALVADGALTLEPGE